MEQATVPQKSQRKLVRSRQSRMIAGVCAGIADYFNIDLIIVRLVFVALIFGGGFGVGLYIVLWIVMPEEGAAGGADERIRTFGSEVRQGAERVAGELRATGRTDRKTVIGLIVVLVGIMILLNQLFPFSWIRGDLVWAMIVIIVGLYLILKR